VLRSSRGRWCRSRGAVDPGKKARQAAQARGCVATPEGAARSGAQALFRLQAEGYYTATVVPQSASAEGRIDVRLRVTRGPKGTGVDVAFEGNKALDAAALVAVLPKPGSHAFFEALDPRSARIASDVRLAYAASATCGRVPTPRTASTSHRRLRSRSASGAPLHAGEIELPELSGPGRRAGAEA
jgi:hypothetical protein